IVVLDLIVCLLFVPLPLFPLMGTLCYGVFCQLGGNPHFLVIAVAAAMGYVGTAITLCFHFRYETILSIARREPEKEHGRKI
ncbi:hypothetical protein PFISCL1PPCAC_14249, partial [Pristionchus fissidentatus]